MSEKSERYHFCLRLYFNEAQLCRQNVMTDLLHINDTCDCWFLNVREHLQHLSVHIHISFIVSDAIWHDSEWRDLSRKISGFLYDANHYVLRNHCAVKRDAQCSCIYDNSMLIDQRGCVSRDLKEPLDIIWLNAIDAASAVRSETEWSLWRYQQSQTDPHSWDFPSSMIHISPVDL